MPPELTRLEPLTQDANVREVLRNQVIRVVTLVDD